MEYNFNNPFNFGWNSSNPFVTNCFTGNSTNSMQAPPRFPTPTVNPQMSTKHHVPGVVPGFNDLLYHRQRLPTTPGTGTSYQFGVNGQFNANQNQSSTGTNFPTDWNYGYVNRLPHFGNPIVNPVQGTPVNNSVNAQSTQSMHPVQSLNDRSVNANDTGSCDVKTSSDQCDKGKDNITNEITLKVSSLLSNPAILQNAISQMQNSTGQKDIEEGGLKAKIQKVGKMETYVVSDQKVSTSSEQQINETDVSTLTNEIYVTDKMAIVR